MHTIFPGSSRLIRSAVAAALLAALVPTLASSEPYGKLRKQAEVPGPLNLSNVQMIDLTYPFDDETIYWPTSPSEFELESLSHGMTKGGYFYSANTFCTPEHGGTHVDAPIHFASGRWTMEKVPLHRLSGPGVVIDVSEEASFNPDYRLSLKVVKEWEQEHGLVPQGSIVLLRTGWGSRWPDRGRYLGSAVPGDASNLHFPSYGREAAEFLITQRKVIAIGVDTASIDHGPSTDFLVHRVASDNNVCGIENVANLGHVPEVGAWIIALPMKIAGGSGAPARVVAFVPR